MCGMAKHWPLWGMQAVRHCQTKQLVVWGFNPNRRHLNESRDRLPSRSGSVGQVRMPGKEKKNLTLEATAWRPGLGIDHCVIYSTLIIMTVCEQIITALPKYHQHTDKEPHSHAGQWPFKCTLTARYIIGYVKQFQGPCWKQALFPGI